MSFDRTRNESLIRTVLAAVGLLVVAGSPGFAQAETDRITFTVAQADAGAETYGEFCASCHGEALQGGEGPALLGGAFTRFRYESVLYFLRTISDGMPRGDPGILSRDEYVNLVAFLAWANGYLPGEKALSDDEAALAAMGFRR